MRNALTITLCALILAGAASAEPIDGKTARKSLFFKKGVDVKLVEKDTVQADHLPVLTQVGETQLPYGAIAVSPSEGLVSEAAVAGANFHDIASARDFAIKGCNARRKKGSARCVVVAEIYPKGWEEGRPLELSSDATNAMRKDYRKGAGPKALSISPKTGKWAIAKGEGAQEAALKACEAAAKSKDCTIVVID